MFHPLAALGRRNRTMLAEAEKPLGTRWWGLPLTASGLAGLALMIHLVGANVLAVNFTTSDQNFKMYSNYVEGIASAGMLSGNTGKTATSTVGVTEIGIKEARLAGFCSIGYHQLPVLGKWSLMILAGQPVKPAFDHSAPNLVDGNGNPITVNSVGALTNGSLDDAVRATDLFINATELKGYGNKLSGLNLGRSADGVVADANVNGGHWPAGQTAPTTGGFGLTAQQLNVANFDGSTYGMDLEGSINLPGLKLKLLKGEKTQSSCTSEANS